MIRIGYCRNDSPISDEAWHRATAPLPPRLTERLGRFRRWQDAQATLFGRLLLRQLMSKEDGHSGHPELTVDAFGRPYLRHRPGLDFNISHTDGLVACALSRGGRVGIDVERRLPIDLREFRRVFTDREYDFLSGTPELTTCFYRLWTRKEAIMKADGRGISLDPAGIDVLTVPRMIGGIRYTLRELKVGPLHAGHLASAGPAGIESQWYRVADLLTQSY